MPHDARNQFEQHVLEMIEQSPTGAVPHTPAHQEALAHLIATHKVYASADFPDGYATVHALAALSEFHAENLFAVLTGAAEDSALESDDAVFDRYVASLPTALHEVAERYRKLAVGRRLLHRSKHDGVMVHDPLHSLFLVPGAGPNPGLPGNYLHGSIFQDHADDPAGTWSIHLHDRIDGAAMCDGLSRAAATEKLEEVLASAPFLLSELEALDFRLN